MKKIATLLMVGVLSVLALGCSQPGDDFASEMTKVLTEHAKQVEAGTYDSEKFLSQVKPLMEKAKNAVKSADGKLQMSSSIHEAYLKALEGFGKIAGEKENVDALADNVRMTFAQVAAMKGEDYLTWFDTSEKPTDSAAPSAETPAAAESATPSTEETSNEGAPVEGSKSNSK